MLPIFCFSQKKITTLKSDVYTIDKGGLIREYEKNIKIKVYDNELIFVNNSKSNSIKLKDMRVSSDGSFTAKIDDGSRHVKYVTYVDKDLFVEYKKYMKIYRIK